MKVKIKKLAEGAVIPTKAHPTDACYDLVATSLSYDYDGNYVYGTGLSVEIPEGYMGLVFPRSSVSRTDLFLTNSVGVIDSGYRGEILVKFKSSIRTVSLLSLIKFAWCKKVLHRFPKEIDTDSVGRAYQVGDRVGQFIILRCPSITFSETDSLDESERGEGGFGSTGE